jgi:prepilin-type N-terminal cleavage/methylation domain-containing protein
MNTYTYFSKNNRINNEKGLSLIEVLMTIVILSVGLLGVANMQVVAIKVNDNSNQLTQATTITQDKVEELMALPFDAVVLADATPPGQFTTHTEADPPPGYAVEWQVDINADGTKTINVNTTWVNAGVQKAFALSMIRSSFQ